MLKSLAVLTLLFAASPAEAYRPPVPAISFVRAKVTRVVAFEVAPGRTFVLAEWGEVAVGTGTAPARSRIVPYKAGACQRLFSIGDGDGAAAKKAIGKTFDGIQVRGTDDALPNAWCRVFADADPLGLVANVRDSLETHAKKGDASLPDLGRVRDFFTSVLPGLDRTPIDFDLEKALELVRTEAGLRTALDHGMRFFASRNYAWFSEPSLYPTVEKYVLAAKPADRALMDLLWRLSAARAQAMIRAMRGTDPVRAHDLLIASPAWDEVVDEIGDILDRERAVGGKRRSLLLATHGNERIAPALRAALAAAPPDDLWREDVRKLLAAIDNRVALGVTDGAKLAALLWKQRDDLGSDAPFTGMRISVTGRQDLGCTVIHNAGAYDIRAKVECDAETTRRMFKRASNAPMTVSGTFTGKWVGTSGRPYVELRLDFGRVEIP